MKREVLDRIINCPETNTDRFLLLAAADEAIDLDGLYILVRREPAALLRLLGGGGDNSNTHDPATTKSLNDTQSFGNGKRNHEIDTKDRSSSSNSRKRNKQNNSNTSSSGSGGSEEL